MDQLDAKLNSLFPGKVVRKDLLHRVKKGTNVPTFVLEFLLARFSSPEESEIEAGTEAVLETLQDNYVRPDEANAAQSKVSRNGKHRFIDKIHVRYVEKEKRHWASLENFGSQRIAIADKFFRENDRLLEGGIWAEVTIGYNEIDDDDYAFFIEEMRPIQLTRFDFAAYCKARAEFTRDEWMSVILRSVGLEPAQLTQRQRMHFIARLAPLVEANFNFIELGPRGTGKSYFFSEFSPYSTLISGGQATKATLFYNNARRKAGLISYWDTIAFDEVAGIRVKDPDTIQIMKDYMANGRFSRGTEVIADASLAFVGNIDVAIEQIVNSPKQDLFLPMPKEFDLAIMDRFACYLPGWEMPKNSSTFLTVNFGFITDYLAEAFHHQLKQTNRYEEVTKRVKLGKSVEGRDEKGIKKTIAAFLKILHPGGSPTDEEFEQYVAYAIECRRRVKEQMHKRKPDGEFAKTNLTFIDSRGSEIEVFCPETKAAISSGGIQMLELPPEQSPAPAAGAASGVTDPGGAVAELKERHFKIHYGETGHSYESIIGPYLVGATEVVIEDAYVRATHQVINFIRFCEAVVKCPTIRKIRLVSVFPDDGDQDDVGNKLEELKQSLLEFDVELEILLKAQLPDRRIHVNNGWIIQFARGLDFYQQPHNSNSLGGNDFALRKCLETRVDIYRHR